jgi:hypothetical protein
MDWQALVPQIGGERRTVKDKRPRVMRFKASRLNECGYLGIRAVKSQVNGSHEETLL